MKDLLFELLKAGRAADPATVEPNNLTEEQKNGAAELAQLGYVILFGDDSFRITANGLSALSTEEEVREQVARQNDENRANKLLEDKKEKTAARRSWAQLFVRILFDLLIFIAGILLEWRMKIVEAILNLPGR